MNPEPDSSEHLLVKADALMRRHREFVAKPPVAAISETPVMASDLIDETLGLADHDDDDLPVLTDIVDNIANAAPVSSAPHETISGETVIAETQRWLDEELPGAVLSVLDGLADHLVNTITERCRADVLDALRKPSTD